MLHTNRLFALTLILSATWLSACGSTQAHLAPSRRSSPTAKLADATPAPPHSFSKQPPREGTLSVYNNPGYGLTLRYPRNYLLDEELDPDDSPALKTQQDWESQQPGAILVATLRIPDDAYPNTTFAAGHLQFVVNASATAAACRSFVAPPDSGWPGVTDVTTLAGIPFYWRDRGSVSGESVSAARDYAGFSSGACYEFTLEVSSSSAPGSDPLIAPADLPKLLRPLEKIVASVQLHPRSSQPLAILPKPSS
jgi:hypothetical protein